MLVVLLSGCGGQSGGESQGSSSGGTKAQDAGRKSVETRIALGRVADASAEGMRLVVRSNTERRDAQRMVFAVAKNAKA